MADKTPDGTDTSLTESGPVSERQEAHEQETSEASLPAPQQLIEQFEQFFAGGISPIRNPVLEKITEDHIATIIRQSGEDAKAARRYTMAYSVIGLIAFFALTVYMMPLDKELYKQIVQVLVAAGGGFGAGYGVRYWQG